MKREGLDGLETMLIDPECSDLRVQGRGWNAKFGGCAGGTGHPALGVSEGRLDSLLLLRRGHSQKWPAHFVRLVRLAREPAFVNSEILSFTNDDGSLNHILKLANVAGPIVR